jgi:3-hydroxyisobutyrate dehydrogenase-like beta-hydroxyacid dehydrogenase
MPTTAPPLATGIVGLGLMGQALARRLLGAGQRVLGHDIDAARVQALAQDGGIGVDSLQVLLADCSQVVLCVYDADQALAVARALPHTGGAAGARRVVLCSTTCDPARMAEVGREVEGRGHDFIEMPISGSSQQFARGTAVGLVACAAGVLAAQQPFIASVCAEHRYLGPAFGDASKAKLAINLVLGINRAALAEGLAFAQGIGLDPERFFAVLRGSAAQSAVMDVKGAAMVQRRFEPPQSRVDQSAKDFGLIVELGRQAGLGLPFARRYAQMMADNIAHGEGALDNAIVIRAIERFTA